ncbi:MAG: hypothetical protein KF832_16200 [Caldilineaceae bacterium]|nr:hypothetical protein [Caldilineaceae bacterium]
MNPTHSFAYKRCTQPTTAPGRPRSRQPVRLFCPQIDCLTDELVVHRIAAQADVWLLTDEVTNHSWLMMGTHPLCPHCGTPLAQS